MSYMVKMCGLSMVNKKEIEKELRSLAQRIRHEVKTPKKREDMLDHIRNILTLIE